MKRILLSLLIGAVAAAIDVGPMIAKRLDPTFILSALFTWLFLGILIPCARITSTGWIDGILVSLMFVIPIACLTVRLDRGAIPVMLGTACALGAGIGFEGTLLFR
jgi:hypothetical protein